MPAQTPLDALTQLPFALWLRTHPFAYPGLEILHIWAIAIVFGTVFLVDLRLMGVRAFGLANISASALSKAVLPWTVLAFCFAALSGLTMFLARAGDFIGNRAFVLKIVFLCIAATNAAALHARGGIVAEDSISRLQAALSILLWMCIIASGRMIAYV